MARERTWILCGQIIPGHVYRELAPADRRTIRAATSVAETIREALDEAEERDQGTTGLPPLHVTLDADGIPVVTRKGPDVLRCPIFQTVNPECGNYAGAYTPHPGTGPCAYHGGKRKAELMKGAIVTAHAIARVLDVTPWDALLVAMRRAYAWSAFYQAKLAEVTDDDDLLPGGDAYPWVQGAERTTESLAKFAKLVLDAGVEERHVQAVELQGRMIAQVLSATLAELGLDEDTETRARGIMETALRALADSGRADVIAGELA